MIRQMMLAAKDAGLNLGSPGRPLKQLAKMLIETPVDEEMSVHLGDDEHDLAGRGNGTSHNEARSKTMITDNAGPTTIKDSPGPQWILRAAADQEVPGAPRRPGRDGLVD